MRLTPHFSLDEFTASDQATRRGIDNTLPAQYFNNALLTAQMMERVRSFLSERAGHEVPITVTSGYRCPDLNTVAGGSTRSDHIRMMAVDFRAPVFGTPRDICKTLVPAVTDLQIGQLILEYSSWVHASIAIANKDVNRVITRTAHGYSVGIA
jgi:zinc D-Ala-D-Ala carboxypeptidase